MISRTSLLFAILLFTFQFSIGQAFPEEKTNQHQNIKGTNIFLVPPAGFGPSTTFKGMSHTEVETAMIMVMEFPGHYKEMTDGFSKEALAEKGMDLISSSEVKIGKYPGLLIKLEQDAYNFTFLKYILIYGNETEAFLINGACLKDSVELSETIRKSMNTIFVDQALNANPREELDYIIDETVSNLKFIGVMGSSILFNRDLKTPTESEDKASLICDKSYNLIKIEDTEEFCLNRLIKLPGSFEHIKERGINKIEIDGLSGHELYASGEDQEELIQIILFKEEGGYYIFSGTYDKNYPQAAEDLKKVILTFKRK